MNRRDFAKSALVSAGLGSVAVAEVEKPEDEFPIGDGVFNVGVLQPTGLHYPSGMVDKINVLIVAPQAAAVLAEYTKQDRIEKGDDWGLSWFHGKHVMHVESDEQALPYYRQLDEWDTWTPCIVRLPKADEVDLESLEVHCDSHSSYRQKCSDCRDVLDNQPLKV